MSILMTQLHDSLKVEEIASLLWEYIRLPNEPEGEWCYATDASKLRYREAAIAAFAVLTKEKEKTDDQEG